MNIFKNANLIFLLRLQTFNILDLRLYGFNPATALLNQNAKTREFNQHLVDIELWFCPDVKLTITKPNDIGSFQQKWGSLESIKSKLSRGKIFMTE